MSYDILNDALDSKKLISTLNVDNKLFHQGKQLAYYEILTTICNRAHSFQIPLDLINLKNVDLDNDVA